MSGDDDLEGWVKVAPMRYARELAAAASLHGSLYVAGGRGKRGWSEDLYFSVVERYLPASDSWEEVASMDFARCRHQLVALGGFLYAIGGVDSDGSPMASAERYDPKEDKWSPIASMSRGLLNSAAASMGGLIYVAGGFGAVDTPRAGCERYDPATNAWSRIADLLEPIGAGGYSCALACLGGSLYLAWGEKRSHRKPTGARWQYNVLTDEWAPAPKKLAAGSKTMVPGFGCYASL